MQTQLTTWAREAEYGSEADEILRRCTHCGFCLATCPTFQITGDELDSPRGRIYQMKLVLEGAAPTHETQVHLDRCLTCNNCETTCPSGVAYGTLVDIGRRVLNERVRRPWRERILRGALRQWILSRGFKASYRAARWMRPVLPARLRGKLNAAPRRLGALPRNTAQHARQVLLLANCVQPAMMPSIDGATIRVLDAVGVGARHVPKSGCCGGINFHLDAQEDARDQMRANVDAWLPLLESGAAEAVVVNVSGCGAMIKDYARHLEHDPAYAERARRLMPYVKDIAEFLAPMAADVRAKMRHAPGRCAFHPPCTLQHWMGLRNVTEQLLHDLGFELQPFNESHLCCGSAGSYSITQPRFATELRDRKLAAIQAVAPPMIASSNVGCICHLQGGTQIPVRHWIEVVDAAMQA